jgi:hypothetical protein
LLRSAAYWWGCRWPQRLQLRQCAAALLLLLLLLLRLHPL